MLTAEYHAFSTANAFLQHQAMSSKAQSLIEEILDPAKDTHKSLSLLEDVARTHGVEINEFFILVDIAFEPMVSSMVRNRIFENCLIPNGLYFIPPEVVLRVLGSIGAPEVYFKKGKQQKLKRFSLATQQRILQWAVNILPFFGRSIYSALRKSLPILFGLLSYEYLRPYIATLIIISTSIPQDFKGRSLGTGKIQSPIRSWHAELISDLLRRFPLDSSLRVIALHFSRLDIGPEVRSRLHQIQNLGPTSTIGEIALPDENFSGISRLSLETLNDVTGDIVDLHRRFSFVYKEFERNAKRRKKGGVQTSQKSDIINATSVERQIPISSINSVHSLIADFENINFINPSSVFARVDSRNQRFRCIYVSLVLISSGKYTGVFKKVSSALQHHILPDTLLPVARNKYLLKCISNFGMLGVFGTEINAFMSSLSTGKEGSFSTLNCLLLLLPYVHLAETDVALPFLDTVFLSIKTILQQNESQLQRLLPLLMLKLSLLVWKLDLVSQALKNLLEPLIAMLYENIDELWPRLSLICRLSFTFFLAHTIQYATEKLTLLIDPVCLIPPPSLIFRLVTSAQLLISSEGLGLVACMKKLKISENAGIRVRSKNAYVMDSINFFYRDMAFKNENGTFNRGMCLHPNFIQRIYGLDFFNNSDLILVKSVGGIVQNPAFAYLCAEILWRLEDQEECISTRHPGPITETSVTRLQQDTEARWLKVSYQDLIVGLLNHLDTLGFNGLADLLFTSLKPLVDRRAKYGRAGP